ncbi:tail fiber assembly protein [Brevundimonas diminuta]|uniref:phage tail assembly chaperone n=1 Tax=Brevundimonas diminuta TaxID=293 RepID=UPI001908012B|nr:phage tail assembly chaperone [Brevundimonas diminuta]MBK1970823.1 tail fiber assembly protein [Brevundimonas diminuta]MBK1974798.1 tail fiber assembly protein [Brevundimonas diminuta]
MTIAFSPSTLAFYDLDHWPHDLPDDIATLSRADHAAILNEIASGRILSANDDGAPVTVTPPAPSAEQLAIDARRRRDSEIAAVRWLVERHRDEQALQIATTLTAEDYRLVQEHVQALRDVPEQVGFPHVIDWPVLAPELLATGG